MKRKCCNLFIVNAFVYISMLFYTPFIGFYFASNNITPTQISKLLVLGPIMAIVVQPMWGRISDKLGKRKLVLGIVSLCSGLSMLCYYIGTSYKVFFFATVCANIFIMAIVPLSDAILIRLSISEGVSFSYIRLGGTIGYAIVALLIGNYLRIYPQRQFILGSLSYLVLFFLIMLLPESINQQKNHTEKNKTVATDIFTDKKVYLVLLLALVCQIGLSFHSGFLGPYMLTKGYTQMELGILNFISAVSEIPILLVIDRVSKKGDVIKLMVFACLMTAIRIVLFTGNGIIEMVISQFLQGVTYMTAYYCASTYISTHVREGYISQGQGYLGVIQLGIGAVIGTLGGGMAIEHFGYKKGYLLVALAIAATAITIGIGYLCMNIRKGEKNEV